MKYIFLFFAIMCCAINSWSQPQQENINNDNMQTIAYIKRAMRFASYYPQEKVYLHLDNTGYFKGETIWFKAYVTRCDTENRTDLSRVLYVELVNPSGDVVEKRKLKIENGEASGDIKVDSIMNTGFYEIRAYTRYMTNWGTNACFSRVIPIFKSPEEEGDYSSPEIDKFSYRHRLNNERLVSSEIDNGNMYVLSDDQKNTKTKVSEGARVRFFPEGGKTVAGLPCRIAFLVVDSEGRPIKTECQAVDADGNVVESLSTDMGGRGAITLSANSNVKGITVKSGKMVRLPEPEASGTTMMMDILNDDSVSVNIFTSEDEVGKKFGYVLMHNGLVIRCDTMTALPHHSFSFNRSKLPSGVSQLTVFDSHGKVMAERLFFILGNERAKSSILIESATKNIKPCGKVSFSLQSEPDASISFSAMDCNGMVNGRTGNMHTWMLLDSELRGYIANPKYYFESDDEEHRKASDLLMMIQGWRRYDWRLYSGEAIWNNMQPIEDRLRIYGKVQGKTKRKPIVNVSLKSTLFRKEVGILDGEFMTDSLGRYVFDVPDIDGEWNLQIASKYKDKATEYKIGIDRNFVPKSRFLSPEETDTIPIDDSRAFKWKKAEEDDNVYISMTEKDHLLQNVTVKAKGRIWDRNGWGDENDARKMSTIYYDCDAAMDKIEDEGEYAPTVAEWLKSKNSFFAGEDSPIDILIHRAFDSEHNPIDTVKSLYDWFSPESPEYAEYEQMPPAPDKKLYRDGLTYKNRPIVWIIDNMFVTVTNFRLRSKAMYMRIMSSDNNSNSMDLPVSLDELKCVYICENPRSMLSHIRCQEIEEMDPVVVYCYTHRKSLFKQKGVRYTHFEGFSIPSVFQMEDYSVLPPMKDVRRTLYWNPNVKTDSTGKANVEFWNNSSCTEMQISAEGMTTDGKAVVY